MLESKRGCVFKGRSVSGEEELGAGRSAALHVSGVLQQQSLQHPHPLLTQLSAVRPGTREEGRGGQCVFRFFLPTRCHYQYSVSSLVISFDFFFFTAKDVS